MERNENVVNYSSLPILSQEHFGFLEIIGMGKLKHEQRTWNTYAANDPLWAILTDSDKKGNKWTLDEFFGSGRDDIRYHMDRVLDVHPDLKLSRALDFGCGVGRLSQALCGNFTEVVGVDIAPKMIEQANRLNAFPTSLTFRLNESPDLRQFETASFDFVLSLIVLQHINAKSIRKYIKEFFRVCKPGGVVCFQVPALKTKAWKDKPLASGNPSLGTLCYRSFMRSFRYAYRRALEIRNALRYRIELIRGIEVEMMMNTVSSKEIEHLAAKHGAKVLSVRENKSCGNDFISYDYIILKES